ncbi:hypothetical protein [Corynebacterium efficiens YS-314]|uniref:Uncharacterized protein n=1 Tax=Corynebacterium efficiens (strain DSM 44549 / YS-314 / AJ 12310 / JCM 11189 / NBRC 100395) TaxID=196164 RepID=Q8FRK4_COREF|nr:hypothetical protein [Corynebacterium efficiens YS-314]
MVASVRIDTNPALHRRVARMRDKRRFGDPDTHGPTQVMSRETRTPPPGIRRHTTDPRRIGYHHRE